MIFRLFLAIAYFITSTAAFAEIVTSSGPATGHEYFVGMSLGKPLVTVNLVNGVQSPGVYHIPVGTNLGELFSYAGGVTSESDLGHVMVRSTNFKGQVAVQSFNFDKSFAESKDALIVLTDKDVVHIEQDRSLDNTVKWMSIASMATNIITIFIVVNKLR